MATRRTPAVCKTVCRFALTLELILVAGLGDGPAVPRRTTSAEPQITEFLQTDGGSAFMEVFVPTGTSNAYITLAFTAGTYSFEVSTPTAEVEFGALYVAEEDYEPTQFLGGWIEVGTERLDVLCVAAGDADVGGSPCLNIPEVALNNGSASEVRWSKTVFGWINTSSTIGDVNENFDPLGRLPTTSVTSTTSVTVSTSTVSTSTRSTSTRTTSTRTTSTRSTSTQTTTTDSTTTVTVSTSTTSTVTTSTSTTSTATTSTTTTGTVTGTVTVSTSTTSTTTTTASSTTSTTTSSSTTITGTTTTTASSTTTTTTSFSTTITGTMTTTASSTTTTTTTITTTTTTTTTATTSTSTTLTRTETTTVTWTSTLTANLPVIASGEVRFSSSMDLLDPTVAEPAADGLAKGLSRTTGRPATEFSITFLPLDPGARRLQTLANWMMRWSMRSPSYVQIEEATSRLMDTQDPILEVILNEELAKVQKPGVASDVVIVFRSGVDVTSPGCWAADQSLGRLDNGICTRQDGSTSAVGFVNVGDECCFMCRDADKIAWEGRCRSCEGMRVNSEGSACFVELESAALGQSEMGFGWFFVLLLLSIREFV